MPKPSSTQGTIILQDGETSAYAACADEAPLIDRAAVRHRCDVVDNMLTKEGEYIQPTAQLGFNSAVTFAHI